MKVNSWGIVSCTKYTCDKIARQRRNINCYKQNNKLAALPSLSLRSHAKTGSAGQVGGSTSHCISRVCVCVGYSIWLGSCWSKRQRKAFPASRPAVSNDCHKSGHKIMPQSVIVRELFHFFVSGHFVARSLHQEPTRALVLWRSAGDPPPLDGNGFICSRQDDGQDSKMWGT